MASSSIIVGQQAPAFTLTALGSNRIVSLASCQGTALLLVFHDQNAVAARTIHAGSGARPLS
ncbi:MAG: hypothetical protein IPM07_28495 [Anaerolineales bacterium]|nr:hypothetical protein [Anaerolineales bacterium]